MLKEEYDKIKCDRCSVVVGLYQYDDGLWRCPSCIWKELRDLIQAANKLLDTKDYKSPESYLNTLHQNHTTSIAIVSRKDMDKLSEAVRKVD